MTKALAIQFADEIDLHGFHLATGAALSAELRRLAAVEQENAKLVRELEDRKSTMQRMRTAIVSLFQKVSDAERAKADAEYLAEGRQELIQHQLASVKVKDALIELQEAQLKLLLHRAQGEKP